MKRVYIAIDGVLNSEAFFLAKSGTKWWDRAWTREDINLNAVDRLNRLWSNTGPIYFTELVLLPSWRMRSVSARRARMLLAGLGLGVPVLPLMAFDKCQAILDDLGANPGVVPIIVDAASETAFPESLRPALFPVPRSFGLTRALANKLELRIIANEPTPAQ